MLKRFCNWLMSPSKENDNNLFFTKEEERKAEQVVEEKFAISPPVGDLIKLIEKDSTQVKMIYNDTYNESCRVRIPLRDNQNIIIDLGDRNAKGEVFLFDIISINIPISSFSLSKEECEILYCAVVDRLEKVVIINDRLNRSVMGEIITKELSDV